MIFLVSTYGVTKTIIAKHCNIYNIEPIFTKTIYNLQSFNKTTKRHFFDNVFLYKTKKQLL